MLKKNLLKLYCMLLLASISTASYAVAETEFNNTWDFANTITLGATGTGTCTATGDIDWWRVTSANDGKLTVSWTATNGLNIYCQVYDTLGVLQFASAYTSGSTALNVDGLTAGTYYLKFFAYTGTQSPTYSFVPTFTTPVQANDVEPNGIRNQAKTLPLNGTKTGHIGYYYKNLDDTLDWWKVTTNLDGKLEWTITSNNGANVYAQLYDNDGVTLFGGSYTSGTATYSVDGLSAGTYYLRIRNYSIGEFAPYTLSNVLVLPPVLNDVEQNGTRALALTLPLNGSKDGHIGYYYNFLDDTLDWYKVTTNLDGRLNFTINSLNGQNVYAELFDNDGATYLAGAYTSTSATYSRDGMSAGTYYIRIRTYSIGNFAPYTLSNTLTLPPVANDLEPNGTYGQALTFNLSDTVKGHIGYYYNFLDDTLDWYKVTTTLEGRLSFYMQSLNGDNVYLNLYDGNGILQLGGAYTSSSATYNVDGLAAGTYYFRVKTYYNSEFAPYKFSVNLITPAQTIDAEPNGTVATAKNIGLNDSISGHLGYYYNNLRDTFDYRKIVLTQYGNLTWTARSTNGQNVFARLLDSNGTTFLEGSYTSTAGTWGRNDLAPGTYYLLMHCYYVNSEFVPYSLKTVFTPVLGTDVEQNGTLATATNVPLNTNFYGCFGYYYNGARDVNDWLKVVTPEDGKIVFTATNGFANTSNLFLEVYDESGVNQFSQYTGGGSVLTYTKANIRKGTYYIKIRGYYGYEYSQYLLNLTFTSSNPTDAESNNTAATSKTILGYTTRSGNIGFNGFGTNTDTVDWHKVGYWALGPLNLIIKKVANPDGVMPSVNFKLYGDPNAAPLYNFDLVNDSTNVSYTLPKATYYIKLTQLGVTYGGYTISALYKDTASQLISRVLAISDTSCGIGQLSYTVYRGKGPYNVQLFKDGIIYGSPVVTSDTAKFTLLDAGYYSVRTNSTFATTTYVWGTDTALVPKVQGLAATSITATSAIAAWTNLPCADGYKFQWRLQGATGWNTIILKSGVTQDTLTGLVAATKYQFRVYSYTTYNSVKYFSKVTSTVTFKTAAARISADLTESTDDNVITVNPNPATDYIQFELPAASDKIVVTITNTIGQAINSIEINNSTDVNQSLNVSTLKTGVYMLTIDANGTRHYARFVKE